jgi:transcriptional regulator with XRE-family HTH domain
MPSKKPIPNPDTKTCGQHHKEVNSYHMIDSAQKKPDKARIALRDLIHTHGTDMATLSRAIGKNHAYIQQYLNRGIPSELSYKSIIALARFFKCSPNVFGIDETSLLNASNDTAPPPHRHPLESIRRLMGLDTAQMAKALNEAPHKIIDIEAGRLPIDENLLLKISRTFQIDPEELSSYAPALNADERIMLLRLRQLTPEQQQSIDILLNKFEKERSYS